ncbi:hypothetical protein K474DRAFT_1626397 [Panus rudis PR-1116 ss-1]|nr:hypothetical protein K474DRAFT_1626397 [Panus rudis PR-1116 ss-1]
MAHPDNTQNSDALEEDSDDESLGTTVDAARAELAGVDSDNTDKVLDAYANLSTALFHRFQRYGAFQDLEESCEWERKAVVRIPEGHPDKPLFYHNLAVSLKTLHEVQRDWQLHSSGEEEEDYLEQSIDMVRAAIEVAGPHHTSLPLYLHTLSMGLIERYEILGDDADLQESVDVSREAVSLTSGQPPPDVDLFLACQHGLGNALMLLYEHTGDVDHLDDAVQLRLAFAENTDVSELGNALHQSSLATALLTRYQAKGADEDLEMGLDNARKAFEATPADHPQFLPRCMNQCAALWHNYERYGEAADLDLALTYISFLVQATEASPALLQRANLLLSVILRTQYERNGSATLDTCLAAARSAVQHIDTDSTTLPSAHSIYWSNLAMCLIARYEQSGHGDDLEEGLSYAKRAVDAASEDSPEFSLYLSTVQLALFRQWEKVRDIKDLERSIQYGERAVDHTLATSPSRAKWMFLLAKCLLALWDIDENATAHLERAYACLKEISNDSSTTTTPSTRFDAASLWANHAFSHHRLHEALDAFKLCYKLIPRLLWAGTHVASRLEAILHRLPGLASNATACAIECGDLTFAIELSEHGRGAMWSHMPQFRENIARLQENEVELIDRIKQVAARLERHGMDDYNSIDLTQADRMAAASRRRELAREWDELVQRAEDIPELGDILRPPSFNKLRLAASNGPVVLLNCSSLRCDALILPSSTLPLQVVALKLSSQDVETMARSVSNALVAASRSSMRAGRSSKKSTLQDPEKILRDALTNLRVNVIQPVLSTLKNVDIDFRRIWWCPTGTFTSLPIHAAMYHNMESNHVGQGLPESYDHIVSSYTPTLSTLLRNASGEPDKISVLAVGVPSTPFATPLPAVKDELQHIRSILSASPVPLTILSQDEAEASIDNVLSALSKNSWVHLACHGTVSTDPSGDPMYSSLILRDGPLQLRRIVSTHLPNAQLAILSACQTAKGIEEMPDEVLHISAGMLFAGFRSVVATLWAIDDEDGPTITRDLYAHCFACQSDGETRNPVGLAPEALHRAVLKMRDQGVSLFRWVPFVHIGT